MTYKSIVLSCIVFLSFFFFDVLACKGEELSTAEQEQRLNANYNSILDTNQTEVCTTYDNKTLTCLSTKPKIEYLYISDSLIVDDLYEDVSARTFNSRKLVIDNKATYQVYTGQPFIKVGEFWYQTETEFVDPEIFDQVTANKLSFLHTLFRNNPFGFYSVNAQETFYAGSGDGNLTSVNAVWATCRAGSGLTVNKVASEGNAYVDDSYIRNLFYTFDLSSLSGGVESATFNFYTPQNNVACNDTNVAFNIIESSATNTTDLYTTNWAPPNYTILSTEKTCSELIALASNEKVTYALNATGITQIEADNLFGLEFTTNNYIEDLGDPTSSSYIDSFFSEQTGTTYDPYLEITLAETGTSTATSTVYNTNCTPDIMNDLSMVNACSYTSSTTGVTYTNYHWPWLIWLIIILPILVILPRILTELTILLRGYGD